MTETDWRGEIQRLTAMNDALARGSLERGQTLAKLQRRLHWQRKQSQRLREELREETALRERLSQLLTETVKAVRGAPAPYTLHDWSTLPRDVQQLRADRQRLRVGGVRMLSQERVTELVEELQSAARAWVSNYAAVHAPHVPGLKVKAILSALGGMSVEEAMRALDEGEASYVQHQQQDGPQARGAAVHDETSH